VEAETVRRGPELRDRHGIWGIAWEIKGNVEVECSSRAGDRDACRLLLFWQKLLHLMNGCKMRLFLGLASSNYPSFHDFLVLNTHLYVNNNKNKKKNP
jgi:hypothetical protein